MKLNKLVLVVCGLLLLGGGLSPMGVVAATADNRSGSTAEGESPLQRLVDQAPSGGTVVVPAGEYEGTLLINKPITMIGEPGAVLRNTTANAAVTIKAAGVRLGRLEIVQEARGESAAVAVTGTTDAHLSELTIRTHAFGILLRDANKSEIRDSKVTWIDEQGLSPTKMSGKRNGIDLFNSHDNKIVNNRAAGMNDGIYLESSDRNEVEGNQVDSSRYGVHLMYTKGTVVRNNFGARNITGAMVMGVKNAEVTGNVFYKQSESVNSQGLLLFDVHSSLIRDNKVEGNRVGLYVEQSNGNRFEHNQVLSNFVGIQLLESEDNSFLNNDFIANVIEAEATDSQNNKLSGNFWDAFSGIDPNGDGRSDISYPMNPFFQQLTSRTPAFQLFFQSPGMLFLEQLFVEGRAGWTTDHAPSMTPVNYSVSTTGNEGRTGVLAVSLLLLAISVLMIYYAGVRRR